MGFTVVWFIKPTKHVVKKLVIAFKNLSRNQQIAFDSRYIIEYKLTPVERNKELFPGRKSLAAWFGVPVLGSKISGRCKALRKNLLEVV